MKWDIFCKIVDNFGDIGVCWRLAQQLKNEHALQVRLWVDNLAVAQKIIPTININKNLQIIDNIEIIFLENDRNFVDVADVVIETFSCGLPENYLQAMLKKQSKWVNLEYLSAESWVADFHAKPSPQANGLTRYFYFPGFTEATGGLIREGNISSQLGGHTNPRPRAGEGARQRGRGAAQVTLEVAPLSNLAPACRREALKISLFCYPNAPIKDLFNALLANIHAASVYVPASSILPQIAEYFGKETVEIGDKLTQNNLTVEILPFLSQADYDQLLRDCDLNFVRGEDSWLRAIWAGKPFIWQPYVQDENAHMKKLEAFLTFFYANYEQKDMLCKAHGYWAAGQVSKDSFETYLTHLSAIQAYTLQQSKQLGQQIDLATKLVQFCNKLVFTKK